MLFSALYQLFVAESAYSRAAASKGMDEVNGKRKQRGAIYTHTSDKTKTVREPTKLVGGCLPGVCVLL
jgi:hypothetical protein